jgi:hypothetical protein
VRRLINYYKAKIREHRRKADESEGDSRKAHNRRASSFRAKLQQVENGVRRKNKRGGW